MREIVHIQAGQAGNQVGAKFWEVRGAKKRGRKRPETDERDRSTNPCELVERQGRTMQRVEFHAC